MVSHRAVWFDFCCLPHPWGPFREVPPGTNFLHVTAPAHIHAAVREHSPHFVCIEFDYPDAARLQSVTRIRHAYPTLPLLMLTEYHSEALAIWAFRSGVWDYRVKPVARHTLHHIVGVLHEAVHGRGARLTPGALPDELIAPAGHLRRPLSTSLRTAEALAYVGEHYGEAVRIETVAALCHLSASEFSRTFHRENETTFRRFLLHYRIGKAREFLREPHTSVSEVAYAVGFNDLSQFGRMFRSVVGVAASDYQRGVRQRISAADEPPTPRAA